MARKTYTPADLRELASEPADAMHPHLVDTMRAALRYCADVIEAADQALRDGAIKGSATDGKEEL